MSLVQQGSSPVGVWVGFGGLMSSGSKVVVSTSKREEL